MKYTKALVIAMLAAACSPPAPGPAATAPAAGRPGPPAPGAADTLKSWNDGAAKRAIVDFVARVTTEGGPEFVAAPERIAVFDNDGTLWTEKPLPFELIFALDRVKALAPSHPEWQTREPFASVLKDDMQGVMASGAKGLLGIVAATHTGMTTDEFTKSVQDWIGSAQGIRRPTGCTPS